MKSKKILSCALAVMLSLGTITVLPDQLNDKIGFAVTADAASDFVIGTDSDGYNYIDGYKGAGGNIVIPEEISYINNNAFEGVTNITSITAKGDLYVYEGAFEGCTKIKKVVVNGNAYIERDAFAYCASLESFEVKGSIDESIGADAFAHCTMLRSFKVSGSEFKYSIGEEAFYNCINLKRVDITSGCTAIYNDAFTNCVSLENLTIPETTKFNTSSGSKNVSYCYAYAHEDDDDRQYIFSDGSVHVFIFYYTYDIPVETYWNTDVYGLYGNYEEFIPRKFTLKVIKNSNAESYAKKYGINYTYYFPEEDELAAPDNVKASAKTANSITLKWNKVSGADAYTVYMYNASTGKYEKYKTVTSNSCTIKKLKKNTKYKFKVSALDKVNGKYKEGKKSDAVAVTTKKK